MEPSWCIDGQQHDQRPARVVQVGHSSWDNYLRLRFYGINLACRCAAVWSSTCQVFSSTPPGHPNFCVSGNSTTTLVHLKFCRKVWAQKFQVDSITNERHRQGTCGIGLSLGFLLVMNDFRYISVHHAKSIEMRKFCRI